MFALRRITSENFESNEALGDSYAIILKGKNDSEFEKTVRVMKWEGSDIDNVYGFISYKSGEKIIPLYTKSHYFIMTGEGKTFANITRR